tara:strand:- start:70 stop:474 length:405 start_codon:yes stop_codon:yes gene_type:complete
MANKKEYFYFIDTHSTGEKIAIVEKATSVVSRNGWTSDYKTIQTAGTNILKIRGVFTDADLTSSLADESYEKIPSRFHEHIVNKVISIGYRDPRNMELNNSQFFDNEYEKGVKKAKKFARSNYINTGRIVQQDF